MRTTTRVSLLLAAALLAACSTDGAPGGDVVAPRPNLAASGAQQRVTGHANLILASLGNAEEIYSNAAIRHADGTVSGEWQLKTEQTDGGVLHGIVTCFTIVGNRARLAGVVDRSTTPLANVGDHVIWTVVDNGEGNAAPPDQTSDFFPVGPLTAAAHCATGFSLALIPVLGGNLQVHQ